MTDELKAELAQLAAENARFREAMEKAVSTFWIRQSSIDGFSETYWSAQGGNKLPYTVLTEAMDGCAPPTPGLGAGMVRVVEAAERKRKARTPSEAFEADNDLNQALNELEAKS